MAYTLISSERSPFGRICRMLMINHGIDFNFRVLNFVDNEQDARALAQETPINKVPLLILGNQQKIFDSRVIANYLIKEHGLRPLSVDEENFVSAIYSCMDVSVTLFLMKHNGYDIQADNSYLRRQRERIPRNLEYIKSWVQKLDPKNPDDWNYASMSLLSFLVWGEIRARTVRLEEYPFAQEFLAKFSSSPGVNETVFTL